MLLPVLGLVAGTSCAQQRQAASPPADKRFAARIDDKAVPPTRREGNTSAVMNEKSAAKDAAPNFTGGGFLFVTFKGEATPLTEQIYFGISQDGHNWEALNGGEPVLISTLGEKGVRDPYLIRTPDNKKFYIIATDLSINHNRSWSRAIRNGSKSIVIWESDDLVKWSEPRLVRVAADDAGCTWAPEVIYDEEAKDYLVYWASTNNSDNYAKHRIWGNRTKDFKTFGEPFIYIDNAQGIIDTDIVRENGKYYRFSKNEDSKFTIMEVSDKLMGPWQVMEQSSLAKMNGYEGPNCFQLEPATADKPATWCLMLDHYSRGEGYKPFITTDISSGQFTPGNNFTFPFRFRHGSVSPITAAEMERLKVAYPTPAVIPLAP